MHTNVGSTYTNIGAHINTHIGPQLYTNLGAHIHKNRRMHKDTHMGTYTDTHIGTQEKKLQMRQKSRKQIEGTGIKKKSQFRAGKF